MRTIGYLLGIPEEGQQQIRDLNDDSITVAEGFSDVSPKIFEDAIALFADYIEWRATHPSDDLMTDLLNAEVEEPDGTRRRLERTEVLAYTAMIAGAGNETTARLIGFMGQLPEGSYMLLLNGSANRDESRFTEPDRYDIHRKGGHLSFGQGLHFCLGSALARLEARIAFEEVLKRWTDWDIDYDHASRARTSSVRGWARLPVKTR